jgi:hypothetical protein
MTALSQRYRTLGELVTELRARLGFVSQGPSTSANLVVMKSFLAEAHDYVYAELKPPSSRKKTTVALEIGSYLYDWHNDTDDEDIDPGLVLTVSIADTATTRSYLKQGISEGMRADTTRGIPTRYDTLNGQCEVWPIPDAAYSMVIEYIEPKPRFSEDADRPGVPDRLLFLYALAQAKAHYRHPDAQAAGATFTNMLRLEKSKQHENRRYIVNEGAGGSETVTVNNGVHTLRIN